LTASELTENDVVSLVAVHLQMRGWDVHTAKTTTERGIDIFASEGERTLYAEAKGSISIRSRRPLDEYQAAVSCFMQASAVRNLSDTAQVVMALPDTPGYLYHCVTVRKILDLARIDVWLVSGLGGIRDLRDAEDPLHWKLKTLPIKSDCA
jgi:hypothetical protein